MPRLHGRTWQLWGESLIVTLVCLQVTLLYKLRMFYGSSCCETWLSGNITLVVRCLLWATLASLCCILKTQSDYHIYWQLSILEVKLGITCMDDNTLCVVSNQSYCPKVSLPAWQDSTGYASSPSFTLSSCHIGRVVIMTSAWYCFTSYTSLQFISMWPTI